MLPDYIQPLTEFDTKPISCVCSSWGGTISVCCCLSADMIMINMPYKVFSFLNCFSSYLKSVKHFNDKSNES